MASRSRRKLTENDLSAIVGAEIRVAAGSGLGGSELADQRQQALEYYHAEAYGNEREGHSQVVTHDVFETIEWAMPALMRIFTASETIVTFEPVSRDDEEAAKQKTDYVNHVFRKDNRGWLILYTWFKDALLSKTGVTKTWWDETDEETRHTHRNVTLDQIEELLADKEVELIEQRRRDDDEVQEDVEKLAATLGIDPAMAQKLGLIDDERYDVVIKRTRKMGRIRVESVPPEEFLISRRAKNADDAPFRAHRRKITVSEGIQLGYDRETLLELASAGGGEGEYTGERVARYEVDDEAPTEESAGLDESMRELWITEAFIQVDWDGDGIAELRKVVVGGDDSYRILDNEPCDEQPFDAITPIILTHKFHGLSLADVVMDLQLIKSTLYRQLLDHVYNLNNVRTAVDADNVDLDDLMTNRVGGFVRVKGNPAASIMPLATPPVVQHFVPLLQMLRDEKEERTGITRYNQGADADTLNKTATGISKIMAAANQRIELIARIFAETGVRDLFLRMQRLIIANQDRPRMVRLRDEWVEMDPRTWTASMDASTEVGLGYDNKEQEAGFLTQLLEVEQAIAQAQGGLEGPVLTWENLYHALKRLIDAYGLKRPELFFTDPASEQGQRLREMARNAAPSPEMIKIEKEHEREMLRIKLEHQRELLKLKVGTAQKQADLDMHATEMAADLTMQGLSATKPEPRMEMQGAER